MQEKPRERTKKEKSVLAYRGFKIEILPCEKMPRAYLVQMQPCLDRESSFAKAKALIENARPESGGLILLPEMFATGFCTSPGSELAEKILPEFPTTKFLQEIADEFDCSVLGGGIEDSPDSRLPFQNWTGFFSPRSRGPSAVYRKRHPFAAEAKLFLPSKELANFSWAGFLAFPFICFDLRFPEDFRKARLQGATLFTVEAEWPAERELHFATLLRARAIENQSFVLACCRAGDSFAASRAFGPSGEELLTADHGEAVFAVDLEADFVQESRTKFPLPLPRFEWN